MTGDKIEKNALKWVFKGGNLTKVRNDRSNPKDSLLTVLLDIDLQLISQAVLFPHQSKLYFWGKIKHAVVLQKEKSCFH